MTDGQQDIIAPDTDDPGNADQLNFESENKAPPPIPVPSHFALLLEPVMFVYAFYIGAIPLLTDQYVRARLSRDYANVSNETSSEICGQNSSRYENDYVSSEASMWMVYASLALLIPAIASLILLGSYSDRGGRKIAIIVPQVGAAVRCISFLAVIYFDWPLYFIVIAAFVEGLSGGISMVIAAGFSYVADITSRDGRSFRIALLEGCFSLGTVVSQVASGYLIASLGFFYPFLILAAIMLLNITVVAVLLPETIVRDSDVRFLSLGHFLKAFNLYFKDDGTGRRWKLLLSLAIVFFTCSVTLGRIDVQIFYLLDLPLCWSPVLIGYFGALFMLIAAPVAVIMTKLTHSTFGDYGLLLIGSISTLAFQAVVTFSTTTILTFMAPVAGATSNLVAPMVRSISSKLVQREEEGAMFATIALAISLSVLLGQIVWNNIYAATVFVWAPLAFLVMMIVLAFTTLLTLALLIKEKLERNEKSDGQNDSLINSN